MFFWIFFKDCSNAKRPRLPKHPNRIFINWRKKQFETGGNLKKTRINNKWLQIIYRLKIFKFQKKNRRRNQRKTRFPKSCSK